ncbi:uncharacterized protein [Rutidosis leptorrhynchoides]|uniref:uncharacterized protein n=1 Tax=Rutidosis leptorrhynchoides TaxID=125765 RepID=UPI003A9A1AAC
MSIIGGDVESVSSSVPSSTAGSAPATPKNRVKFLCSHDGKILPRPADGHLKYVGGETRVICVLRDITFSELMKKLTSMFDGEMILKYQLMPEDLDVLITVKSDEDVRHMIDECDRHEYLGAPRLRAFLFPTNQIITVNHMGPMDPQSLEQRYINYINGIVVHPTSPVYKYTCRPFPVNTSYTTFSISSACSSPRTPPENTSTATNSTSAAVGTSGGKTSSLTKNHSSPSLYNLGCSSVTNHQNQIVPASPTYNYNQSPQHSPQPHHFHPHLHPHVHSQPHSSPKPPLDRQLYKAEHGGRMRSPVGDCYRYQADHTPTYSTRTNKNGHVYYQRGLTYDEYYGNCKYDRMNSPPSPDVVSPSHRISSGR